MSQAKKFGTFAGVFTPSILTILGVIMYLRLGWVVGQAGLINTLIIILIAHIISISTGLSISSIATDKKIRTGGIYYMLSRSLGLPAGGAIGITIFVGTALSISLYVIGFTESFLSLDAISGFLGLAPGIASNRIIGTIVIVMLVILAFISTSVVIKTQFFILGAIALSLISITIGLFIHSGVQPVDISITPNTNAPDMALIFGIFFPAVTGFTAGVAMSGDLKDSKKAIPQGTLLAIGVGFVIYVCLAIGLAYFVNRDMLVNDPDFLLKIAWFSPLVIAGIWGATLSSALGGILGAPRIMQAMAMDKLSPKFLGKGVGKNNEPRNALILTFIIAEMGILIGELNVIAGIVSMFYIAAYGFINLAFTLENWASADFRPSFKVNKWIGIIGFISCFAVMYELDPVTMIAAIIMIGLIYLFLRKRNLRLDYGDVWTSVWNSLTRSVLKRANKRQLEERNWKPNIILFSGGTNARPHLVNFGIWLAGKHGFVSNFDLIETEPGEVLFPKKLQRETNFDNEKKGIYTRRHTCTDIFEGIETIARTYGFSGIEPNTVLMGWARQTRDPKKFTTLLNNLNKLDLNVLLLDYDQKKGYGNYNIIDIWVKPHDLNGLFPLFIVRFLWLTEEWTKSKMRIMVINDINEDSKTIYRSLNTIIDQLRLDAEIRVINNQFEKKAHHEIIRNESADSDLIIIDIPDFSLQSSAEWILNVDELCKELASVLLVKSSSDFAKLNLSFSTAIPAHKIEKDNSAPEILSQYSLPLHPELSALATPIFKEFLTSLNEYSATLNAIPNQYITFLQSIEKECDTTLNQINTNISNNNFSLSSRRSVYRKLIINIRNSYETLQDITIPNITSTLQNAPENLKANLTELFNRINEIEQITLNDENISIFKKTSDTTLLEYIEKIEKKLNKTKEGINLSFHLKGLVKEIYNNAAGAYLAAEEKRIAQISFSNYIQLQNIQQTLDKSYQNFLHLSEDIEPTAEHIKELRHVIGQSIHNAIDKNSQEIAITSTKEAEFANHIFCELTKQFNQLGTLHKAGKKHIKHREIITFYEELNIRNANLNKTLGYLFNAVTMELNLILFHTITESRSTEITNILKKLLINHISQRHVSTIELLKSNPNFVNTNAPKLSDEEIQSDFNAEIEQNFHRLQRQVLRFPESFTVLNGEFLNALSENMFEEPITFLVSSRQLLDHMFQQEFAIPIKEIVREAINNGLKSYRKEQDLFTRLAISGLSEQERLDYINAQIELLGKEVEELELILHSSIEKISLITGRCSDLLMLEPFLKTAANMRQYIRSQEREKATGLAQHIWSEINHITRNLFTQMWYRQSEGFMLKERIRISNEAAQSGDHFSRIGAKLSTSEVKTGEIPFHYRQLFLRKQQYSSEFWVGRKNEYQEFKLFYQQYQALKSGGIIITGEQYSGKSYFCLHMAASLLPNSQVFVVTPPSGGSVSIRTFNQILLQSLDSEKTKLNEALDNLPDSSVIILDDIELWWQKDENGSVVINRIGKLINEYGHRILFITNVNKISYEIMKQLSAMETYFIGEVRLFPFSVQELETIILRRHRAGEMKFCINKRNESAFRPWHYARLFSRYFTFSKGNIGTALYGWISSIQGVEGSTLKMEYPRIPDDLPIEKMNQERIIIILQLAIHKQMSMEKLYGLLQMKKEEILFLLTDLYRKNLVISIEDGIYELNPELYPFIIDRLKATDLL